MAERILSETPTRGGVARLREIPRRGLDIPHQGRAVGLFLTLLMLPRQLVVSQTPAQLHHHACHFSFSSPKYIVVYYAETDPVGLGKPVVRLGDNNDAG